MTDEYDESVIVWFPLNNGKIMLKIKDKEGFDDEKSSKKINSQLCHLGSIILSNIKRLMNDVILASDGLEENKIYYGTPMAYIYTTMTMIY